MPVTHFDSYTAAPVENRTFEVHQVTRPVEIRTTTKVSLSL